MQEKTKGTLTPMEQRYAQDDPLYDLDAAGEYLGGIAKPTLYSWLSRGTLRRTRVGSRVMIRRSELDKMIRDESHDQGERSCRRPRTRKATAG